ncbi:aminotransferase [Gilbertella persicaria]|uniref:aminotransferase n=1 Tax=Gilbertella persicaria TaxID=101096 RepID=UPI00221ECEAB|nr:aminotransferase [Gilbertella persicaria]KAI8053114.1 aminotransferase [Gilbertella persicaria]
MSKYTSQQVNPTEPDMANVKYDIQPSNKTFNDFILSYPSGAYTGMRTVNRDAIVELKTHMQRMTNSISHIQFKGDTVQATEKAERELAPFKDSVEFEHKLMPLLKNGLEAYYEHIDETTHTEHPYEAKVSIVLTYSFKKQQPCFAAHFAHLKSFPSHTRVKVEIERKARKSPEVKDSQWVRERQDLEKNKPRDVNEVILMDDADQLYEGMASNFLAVKDGTVYCASLDHILLGSILKIVIELCKKHNIPFQWEFPTLQDAKQGKWEGCFVTSTSRLLLPIETIYVNHESIEFPKTSPIIEFLREHVAKEISNTACKVL